MPPRKKPPEVRAPAAVVLREVRSRFEKGYPLSNEPGSPARRSLGGRLAAAKHDVWLLLRELGDHERALTGLIHGFAVAYGGNEHVEGAAKNLERVVEGALERAVEVLTARIGERTEVFHLRRPGQDGPPWCGQTGRLVEGAGASNCVDCLRLVLFGYAGRLEILLAAARDLLWNRDAVPGPCGHADPDQECNSVCDLALAVEGIVPGGRDDPREKRERGE